MTTTTHVFPNAALAVASGEIDLATSLGVLLIDAASTPYVWNSTSQAHVHVSDILGGSGGGALTEVSVVSTNYARKVLTGLSGTVSSLTAEILATSPVWANATFTAQYAFFYENVHTTDSTRYVLCYWDFSSNIQPAVAAPFSLNFSGGVILESVVT